MIDVKELRFGNFVAIDYQNSEKLPCAVLIIDGVEPGVFTDLADHLFVSCQDLHPIPLTEEWLLRLGFENDGGNDGTHTWCFRVSSNESYTGRVVLFSMQFHQYGQYFFYKEIRHVIKHVHQLQNLFVALTGQELTIKS